jgi:hypothetical protein
MICLIALVITSGFLLLTDFIIQICFKIRKKTQKPKILNTINFKTLNLAYGFSLLGTAMLHLIAIQFKAKDTYIVHYTVSIVGNMMLGSFLFTNEDTKKYVKYKVKMWRDQKKQIQETKSGNNSNNREVGPWMSGSTQKEITVPRSVSYRSGSERVFVIDIV